MNILERLENWNGTSWAIIGFSLIAGLGLLGFITGYELSFSLFYLIPVSLLVWFAGIRLGITASFFSTILWFITDILSGQHYSHTIIYFRNSAIRFGFFIIVTLLLFELKTVLEHEKNSSRKDRLTGATSVDFFYDLLQMEIDRFQRYKRSFSVAYVDLDNFKSINDQFGHTTGDTVLRSIVFLTKKELRKTDIVARLGGDEFVILLPETDQAHAQAAINKIQQSLLGEMKNNNWPVTFSIGVVTFNATPGTGIELIKITDELMYSVKKHGKNAIRYSVFGD